MYAYISMTAKQKISACFCVVFIYIYTDKYTQ